MAVATSCANSAFSRTAASSCCCITASTRARTALRGCSRRAALPRTHQPSGTPAVLSAHRASIANADQAEPDIRRVGLQRSAAHVPGADVQQPLRCALLHRGSLPRLVSPPNAAARLPSRVVLVAEPWVDKRPALAGRLRLFLPWSSWLRLPFSRSPV